MNPVIIPEGKTCIKLPYNIGFFVFEIRKNWNISVMRYSHARFLVKHALLSPKTLLQTLKAKGFPSRRGLPPDMYLDLVQSDSI